MQHANQRSKIWGLLGRLLVCGLLLLAIFNAIFKQEGNLEWTRQRLEPAWKELPKVQQWRFSWEYGPKVLWKTLREVDAQSFAISQFWMAVILLLGVIRWRMVLKVHGLQLPIKRAFHISIVAQFFNSFLLGSSGGDVLKAYYTARETHHKKTEAVVTVFVDRLIGLFSMLLFACLMMIPNLPLLLSGNSELAVTSAIILAMTLGLGGLVAVSFWGGVSRSIPQARIWLRKIPKGELIEKAIDACRIFGRDPSFLLRTVGISMVLNGACVLQIRVLALGLGIHLPDDLLFLIVPMITCISALPVTPGGLGVRENLFVLILKPFGITETLALSLSLLAFVVFITWSLIGGLVYLTIRHSAHLDDMAKEEN